MDLIEVIILGIIQGLTEFLPISSSGHLEIANKILNNQIEQNNLYKLKELDRLVFLGKLRHSY